MRILVVNGSHRQGNSSGFVKVAKDLLEMQGHSVEVLELLERRFEICNGCLTCEETGVCTINDLFTAEIYPKLAAADGFVFATPIYFNTVTALFKNFIDRTNCLCEYFGKNPKKAAIFLVGQLDKSEGSAASALNYLKEYAEIMNFDLSDNSIFVTAREAGEIELTEDMKNQINQWFL